MVAWLLGHLCQDLGVLRKPRKAGATELGGSVPSHLHIGLRLKTKLSDFRTFHSGKNNCTWGKTCRHFSKSSSRFNNVPKASGIDRFGLPRTNCTYPASLISCGPKVLVHQNLGTEETMREMLQGHLCLALLYHTQNLQDKDGKSEAMEAETGRRKATVGEGLVMFRALAVSQDAHNCLTGKAPSS